MYIKKIILGLRYTADELTRSSWLQKLREWKTRSQFFRSYKNLNIGSTQSKNKSFGHHLPVTIPWDFVTSRILNKTAISDMRRPFKNDGKFFFISA